MITFSLSFIVLLNIVGPILTNPVQEQTVDRKSTKNELEQAFRKAEQILNRYYYLMNSDTDHLVHGMLHLLMNNPTAFPYVPNQAMTIAFKNIEQKLGQHNVELLAEPLLLAIDENYLNKSKQQSPVKITDETREKIEAALDKFLDETNFDAHL